MQKRSLQYKISLGPSPLGALLFLQFFVPQVFAGGMFSVLARIFPFRQSAALSMYFWRPLRSGLIIFSLGIRSSKPGPGGTTLVWTSVTFDRTCNVTALFYVTDVDTSITVDGYVNEISAREAKLSVKFWCPYREQLLRYQNISLSERIWTRGRELTVVSYFNVISSSGFSGSFLQNFLFAVSSRFSELPHGLTFFWCRLS